MRSVRPWAVVAPLLLLALPLTGCEAGTVPDTPLPNLPQGGVNTTIGAIHLDDIVVEGPHGLAPGAAAPLHMVITNDSTRNDTLVSIATPVASEVSAPSGGTVVPAGQQVDLENRDDLVLRGVRKRLQPGQWFPMTFRFVHAGAVTVDVTVGPLGQ
jgi:copper(I)-binding protein